MSIQNDNLFVFCKGSLVLDSWFLTKPNYSLRTLGSVIYGVVFLPMHLMQFMLLAPLKSILMWDVALFKESSLRFCRTLAHIPALLIPSKVEKAGISQIKAYQKVIQKGSLTQSALLINQLKEQQTALKEQQDVDKSQIEKLNSSGFLFKAWLLLGREVTQETLELLKRLISNPELANSLKWSASSKDSGKKNYSVFFNDNGTEKSLSNISTRIFCVKPVDGGACFLAAEIPKEDNLYTKRILGKGSFNTARLVRAIDPVTWNLKYYVMKKERNRNSPANEFMVNTLQASLKKNPAQEKCFVLPIAKGYFLREKESKNHSNTMQKIHLEEVFSKDLLAISNKMLNSSAPFSALYSTFSSLFIGLDRLHELGLFHSDIKHGNIFLTQDNKALLGDWDVDSFTKEFSEPFAVLYKIGQRSNIIPTATRQADDIWALGVVIADMLYTTLFAYRRQNPTQNAPKIQGGAYYFLWFNVNNILIPSYIKTNDTFDEKEKKIKTFYLPEIFKLLEGCFKEYEAAFNATELSQNPVEKKHFDFLLGICRDILLKDNDNRITALQIMERARKVFV